MSIYKLTYVRPHLPYALRVHEDGEGNSHYLLVECGGPGWKKLLELGIEASGRKVDYLKLDKFWGHISRPLDVIHLPRVGVQ